MAIRACIRCLQTGWTLCFEFYFYLIFAFLLLWPRKVFWLAAASIFGGCIAAGAWSESSIPVFAHVAFNPLLFEFYVGAIIGALYLNGLALPRGIALLVLVLGIAGVFAARNVVDPGGWVRVLSWGSASAAILLGAISLERANWIAPQFAVALGDSSYSLYLTHPFVLPVFGKVGLALGITTVLPPFVFGVVVFLAALTAGHITYHLIERPLTTRLTKPASGLHFAVAR
jgi:peptidoglycan/LPS O-acetylase OafA/YrhL